MSWENEAPSGQSRSSSLSQGQEMQAGTSPLLRALGSDPAAPTPNFLFLQSATDIAQIRELQTQVEDVKKEKQSLQEKVIPAQPVAPLLRSGTLLGWRNLFLFLAFTAWLLSPSLLNWDGLTPGLPWGGHQQGLHPLTSVAVPTLLE